MRVAWRGPIALWAPHWAVTRQTQRRLVLGALPVARRGLLAVERAVLAVARHTQRRLLRVGCTTLVVAALLVGTTLRLPGG